MCEGCRQVDSKTAVVGGCLRLVRVFALVRPPWQAPELTVRPRSWNNLMDQHFGWDEGAEEVRD